MAAQKLSPILEAAMYNFGLDIDFYVNAGNKALVADFDKKFAALSAEDDRFNGVIDSLLKISDAKPDTPEWDEGLNLYEKIDQGFVSLIKRTETAELSIVELQAFAKKTTSDIATSFEVVNLKISTEIADRKAENVKIRTEISDIRGTLENKDALTDQAISGLETRLKSQETQMQSRKTEISALQENQTDFEARITFLSDFLEDFSIERLVSAFRDGLQGNVSSFGYAAVPRV